MKVFSGVVVAVAVLIMALAVALLVIDPSSWLVALVAVIFLPFAAFVMHTTARIRGRSGTRRGTATVRASMVGGGALLISALGSRIAEAQGEGAQAALRAQRALAQKPGPWVERRLRALLARVGE